MAAIGLASCGGLHRPAEAGARPPIMVPPSTVPPAPGSYEKLGITFTSARVGYLVAVGNVHYGGETTAIRKTTDGGVSWRTVWAARDLFLYWIGRAGPDLIALGARSPQASSDATLGSGGTSTPFEPVVVTGDDGGTRWTINDARLPAGDQNEMFVAAFASSTTGVAVPDPDYFQFPDNASTERMMRTTDGGKTWNTVSLPDGQSTGGVAFTDQTTGFATGRALAGQTGCRSELWRTADGGTTWAAVPGTCFPFGLAGVTFATPSIGYAVGGTGGAGDGDSGSAAVAMTTDGGATWQIRYVGPSIGLGHTFTVAAFSSPGTGYALAGSCQGSGGQGACDGRLWETDDRGRTWTPTALYGAQLSAPVGGRAHVVGGVT